MSARQTKVENLRDMITNLGYVPVGDTTAELLDQLETLVATSGGISEAQVQAMVNTAVDSKVEIGSLEESDITDIFGA